MVYKVFGKYLYKTILFILYTLLYFKGLILSDFFGHFGPILGPFLLFFGVGVGSRIDFWSYSFRHITSMNPQDPFCGYCFIFSMNNTVDFKKCNGPSE